MTGAVFLIGLGCLFYFGFWPGILFLCGGIMLIRSLYQPRSRGDFESAAALIGLGVWASLHFNVGALFIIAGAGMLISMGLRNFGMYRPVNRNAKPEPPSDGYLD